MAWSLLIKNGTVVDGSGAPGVVADVALDGDRIAAIGPNLTGEPPLHGNNAVALDRDVRRHRGGAAAIDHRAVLDQQGPTHTAIARPR